MPIKSCDISNTFRIESWWTFFMQLLWFWNRIQISRILFRGNQSYIKLTFRCESWVCVEWDFVVVQLLTMNNNHGMLYTVIKYITIGIIYFDNAFKQDTFSMELKYWNNSLTPWKDLQQKNYHFFFYSQNKLFVTSYDAPISHSINKTPDIALRIVRYNLTRIT